MVIKAPETLFSTCPHDCPSQCALEVERLDSSTIGRVYGARDQRYTDGVICSKVARYAERVHHKDRISSPLRRSGRKGGGEFIPITWAEALDTVAKRFIHDTERFGSEAIWPYYYGGTMGRLQRDGINRLRHVKRYSGMAKTICASISSSGWKAGIGAVRGSSPYELAEADLILIWGTNAVATQVNVMHHVTRARKERGAKLVVIDPYKNATAKVADQHVCIRPGTDGALAVAMMHVLFREGLADQDYMDRFTDVPHLLERHLKNKTPEWGSKITGIPVETIEELARNYGQTDKAFIRVGFGLTRQRNGAAAIHSISCLPSVTGKWLVKGGGAFFSNSDIYGLDTTLIEGLDVKDTSVRILDMSQIGRILCGCTTALLGGPPVTAMLIQNTNPMAVAPEHNRVREGFSREDLFVCVHEQFMTETARMADIILPATTFLEHNDIYVGGGHSYLQLGPKLIESFGEARSNHRVICDIASRLGANHAGFNMNEEELIDATLKSSGHPSLQVLRKKKWVDLMPDFEASHFMDGFPTPDGKFHFSPNWKELGDSGGVLAGLPDHIGNIEQADMEHPFRLVTAPARSYLNTSFTETPTSLNKEVRPEVMIHPESASKLGIESGDLVTLGNKRGEVYVHVRLFEGVLPEVVIVEGIWPNYAFEGGIGINALTSADAVLPNGGAAFHDTSVWIRASN